MKGTLKSSLGLLEWKLTDNGVVSFKNPVGKKLRFNNVSYSLIANLQTDNVCRIVSITCKLPTNNLEAEICTLLPEEWKQYLQTHPSIMRVHRGDVQERIRTSEKQFLWKILAKMEAQMAAMRMTLENLDK